MILVKYKRFHIPERCQHKNEHNQAFHQSDGEERFWSADQALKQIASWNTQALAPCWVFAPISIETVA